MDADTLSFRVRSSSSDEVYDISATFSPRLKITCTCQAGVMGNVCKHRTALLLEDASAVVDVNMADLRNLSQNAKASPLGNSMEELSQLEAEADRLKKKISAQKKQIARLLNGETVSNSAYAARY